MDPRRGPLISLLALALACSDGGTLPSPTVRVDLREHLPPEVQRRVAALDTGYECRRSAVVEAHGARQRFLVTYKVIDEARGRYLTAVQVEPEGAFVGGRDPSAAAVVGDPVARAGQPPITVPVEIRWTATQGCQTIDAGTRIELRSDDPSCRSPAPRLKIFSTGSQGG